MFLSRFPCEPTSPVKQSSDVSESRSGCSCGSVNHAYKRPQRGTYPIRKLRHVVVRDVEDECGCALRVLRKSEKDEKRSTHACTHACTRRSMKCEMLVGEACMRRLCKGQRLCNVPDSSESSATCTSR
jgi:hypothetical protein